jgi:hypothetical protein
LETLSKLKRAAKQKQSVAEESLASKFVVISVQLEAKIKVEEPSLAAKDSAEERLPNKRHREEL